MLSCMIYSDFVYYKDKDIAEKNQHDPAGLLRTWVVYFFYNLIVVALFAK